MFVFIRRLEKKREIVRARQQKRQNDGLMRVVNVKRAYTQIHAK